MQIRREPADESAILRVVFQLLEPVQKVFHEADLNGPLVLATDRSKRVRSDALTAPASSIIFI
jgi:hypothetical protein